MHSSYLSWDNTTRMPLSLGPLKMKNVGAYIFLCTLSCVLLIRGRGVQAAPASHLVDKLPGQPNVGFRQYAGYVTVNATAGRALFYYFAEVDVGSANATPTQYPLTIWLNEGPGCSSVGGGAFLYFGPFYPQSDGRGLRINNESWNKVSNMLFVEAPAGVGWSYSNTSSDYSSVGDNVTAIDTLRFLLEWLQLFPEYKNSDFYITGESYAGHYVPQLASLVLTYKGSDGFKFNLKGIAMGNPLFRVDVDVSSIYDYLWSHGIISDLVYDGIVKYCEFQYFDFSSENYNLSESCSSYLAEGLNERSNYISIYDVLLDVCNTSLVQQELILGKMVAHISNGVDVCMGSERDFYFNIPEVQMALHANVTNLSYPWALCSDFTGVIDFRLEDGNTNMLPLLKDLHMQGLRIWVYSGDGDSVIPVTGTMRLIRELAGDLELNTSIPYSAWFHEGQVGGWTIAYGKNLTFATVRGAGHSAAYSQPARALTLFKSFLAGNSLPSL